MSVLRTRIEQYLRLRRSFGFTLNKDEYLLAQFASNMEDNGTDTITVDAALAWAVSAGGTLSWHADRLAVLRRFLLWAHAFDADLTVPPPGMLRQGSHRATPYLYSSEQIRDLVRCTGQFQPRLKSLTFATLIGLLASTGMRVGEAINANIGDLDDAVLTIRDTNFGKTRMLPLHPTTREAVSAYRQELLRELTGPSRTPALFVSHTGSRLRYQSVHADFQRLTVHAGIPNRTGNRRPRIHDLRHTFAVNTMVDAYRDGRNPSEVLPVLSTYLGHARPASTYWYLEASPELLAAAAGRMES